MVMGILLLTRLMILSGAIRDNARAVPDFVKMVIYARKYWITHKDFAGEKENG
ncbi:MAG: hypothetical protein U5N58_01505 [Actinomycetota bacterium]|nr:hypothetical protein [Actinomycetota bacterium]